MDFHFFVQVSLFIAYVSTKFVFFYITLIIIYHFLIQAALMSRFLEDKSYTHTEKCSRKFSPRDI